MKNIMGDAVAWRPVEPLVNHEQFQRSSSPPTDQMKNKKEVQAFWEFWAKNEKKRQKKPVPDGEGQPMGFGSRDGTTGPGF